MSPERKARVIACIREMYALIYTEAFDDRTGGFSLETKTDAQLTALLVSLEALLERAQGTDV